MMMRWIPVALILAVTACSSTPKMHYYQLPISASNAVVSHQSLPHPVWVENVAVADYLAGTGVVYQRNDVQYVIATSNRWASPLDQQLQQALVSNLSADLPGALVSSAPLGQQQDTLNVTVTGFHGRYDGRAVITGQWVLQREGNTLKRSFTLVLPQPEDGYDPLVRTLAQGWKQISTQIANAIIQQG